MTVNYNITFDNSTILPVFNPLMHKVAKVVT